MNPSSVRLRNVPKSPKNSQTFGEIVVAYSAASLKSMSLRLLALMIFVVSPIWNHPGRMKLLTHWFVIAIGAISGLWILYWIGQRPVFNIEQIEVQSMNNQELEHIKVPMIKAKAINQFSGNFFTLRLDTARKAFEEMPWVRQASVRRVWPNQIQVSIEEQEPVGVWFGQNGPELINTYGEIFTVNLAETNDRKNLVSFQGPPNSNKEVLELYQYLDTWFKKLDKKVVALTLSPRYSWTVKLDNGMIFELGRDLNSKDRTKIVNQLDQFYAYWPELEKRLTGSVEYVDLRYSHGFSVRTGTKQESKANEIKLAGLQQKLSMPVDEIPQMTDSLPALTTKEFSPKTEVRTEDKAVKRGIKKVKQSEKTGNQQP